ncbi:hypothetical protein IW262DRAFT_28763 [Armillaria fumosa]|nr:hypothetical protein IW262DRAFT_28763 [Armillaria fumosa]
MLPMTVCLTFSPRSFSIFRSSRGSTFDEQCYLNTIRVSRGSQQQGDVDMNILGAQIGDCNSQTTSTTSGAVHPYPLVTERLLATYSAFQLYTHTPCFSIHDAIILPAGISAPNASSMPPIREKRGPITSQCAGMALSDRRLGTLYTRANRPTTKRINICCGYSREGKVHADD